MEAFELILLLLAAVLLSAIIDQIVPKVSSPLIQIGLGLLIALFAVSPIEINVDPELFLVLFIAPLLFYDTKRADKAALLKNIRPVVSLAIGLVIATTLIIGYSVNFLIPSVPLAAAFALGAALGPTDAVAVSSLSKEVNLNKRQSSILNGEFLINDASGIVSFQFAIAAVVTGAFSFIDAGASFVVEFLGGIAVGIILGLLANFVMRKIRAVGLESTTFHVLFEVFLPFIIFLLAEFVHTSGILAVVAAGMIISLTPREIRPSVSRTNIVSSSVWRVIDFTLNGLVFVLLGAQLPNAMSSEWESLQISNFFLIEYVFLITFILMLVRFLWVLAMDIAYMRRKEHRKYKKSDIRTTLVTTLAGSKGAITLSIVLTIPFFITTDAGDVAFPQRSLIIFLASGVIVLTLLIATFVIPLIAPKKEEENNTQESDSLALLEILRNVLEALTAQETPENKYATQAVIRAYNKRITRMKNRRSIESEPDQELRIKAIGWEQDYVMELIEKGAVDEEAAFDYLNHLAHVKSLILHKSESPVRIRRYRYRLRLLLKRIQRAWAGKFETESSAAERDIRAKVLEYTIKKLQEEIARPDAPSEYVSALLLEYERSLSRCRNDRIDVNDISKHASSINTVHLLALALELEQIQAMYEAERISRATAKKYRDNVHLMQIDLETLNDSELVEASNP